MTLWAADEASFNGPAVQLSAAHVGDGLKPW